MKLDIIKKNGVEILLAKYADHTEDLRHRAKLDINFLTGYISANFIIGGFLFKNPLDKTSNKVSFLIFTFSLTVSILILIINNTRTRKEVIKIIQNINEALKFYKPNVYLSNELNPDTFKKPKFWYPIYIFLICFTFIGQLLIIFS